VVQRRDSGSLPLPTDIGLPADLPFALSEAIMSKAWMPMYWGDYFADTRHLTTLQHGAYLLLIGHYWQHGELPTDEAALAKICGLNGKQWASNCQAIAKLFLPQWRHKRIERELEKAKNISMKRSVFGRKGGTISRGKTNVERFSGQAIAKQMGHQSQSPIYSSTSSDSEAELIRLNGHAEVKEKERFSSEGLDDIVRRKGWV
jgi:uncharacterized protein YdaU (DUF1376 family)